uniref:Uncharacterized protein LOC100372335 n=1 Tax=Saccoglossus kowalevskii TaxID=10224 RepID=A0ABM0GUK5_SACKO|nr:PREDICTED: uncharacterized protein LOC100372335 [Saccoglossus kowalevskii]
MTRHLKLKPSFTVSATPGITKDITYNPTTEKNTIEADLQTRMLRATRESKPSQISSSAQSTIETMGIDNETTMFSTVQEQWTLQKGNDKKTTMFSIQTVTAETPCSANCGDICSLYNIPLCPCTGARCGYLLIGCFTDTYARAIPTLEGTDSRLDGYYKTRINPIEKCASVAIDHGYGMFAVQNGGWKPGVFRIKQYWPLECTNGVFIPSVVITDCRIVSREKYSFMHNGFTVSTTPDIIKDITFNPTTEKNTIEADLQTTMLKTTRERKPSHISSSAQFTIETTGNGNDRAMFSTMQKQWTLQTGNDNKTTMFSIQTVTAETPCPANCGDVCSLYNVPLCPCTGVTCDYFLIGCFTDTYARAIPTLEGTDARLDGYYKTRINPIEKCAAVALDNGYGMTEREKKQREREERDERAAKSEAEREAERLRREERDREREDEREVESLKIEAIENETVKKKRK